MSLNNRNSQVSILVCSKEASKQPIDPVELSLNDWLDGITKTVKSSTQQARDKTDGKLPTIQIMERCCQVIQILIRKSNRTY